MKLLLQGEQNGIPSWQEFGRGWFALTKSGSKRGYSVAVDLEICVKAHLVIVPASASKETFVWMAHCFSKVQRLR